MRMRYWGRSARARVAEDRCQGCRGSDGWDARAVRTHDGEQHVVQQQREEHDEQDQLARVAAVPQPS